MNKDISYMLNFIGSYIDHNRDSIINRVKETLNISPEIHNQNGATSFTSYSEGYPDTTISIKNAIADNATDTNSNSELNSRIIHQVDDMVCNYCDLAIADLRKVRTSYVNTIEDNLTQAYGRNNFLANLRMHDDAGYYIQDKIFEIARQIECDINYS